MNNLINSLIYINSFLFVLKKIIANTVLLVDFLWYLFPQFELCHVLFINIL